MKRKQKKWMFLCCICIAVFVLLYVTMKPHLDSNRMIRAIHEDDVEQVKTMLESGCSPNIPDFPSEGIWYYINNFVESSPDLPLAVACSEGNPEIVRLLLEYGADPVLTEGDHFGWSAMSCAIMSSEDEDCINIVKMLLDHGARIDNTGDYYLPVVLASNEYPHRDYYTEEEAQRHAERIVELVTLLIGDMDVNMDNGVMLEYAVRWDNLPLVKYLLSIGADPYRHYYDIGTAYDLAVKWENHEIAQYLFQWMAEHPL